VPTCQHTYHNTGAALWRTITTNFTLEATEAELLRLALEALDRADQQAGVNGDDNDIVVTPQRPRPSDLE